MTGASVRTLKIDRQQQDEARYPIPNANPSAMQAPKATTIDIRKYPKLDIKQAGHLRHLHNLVSQLDGEWSHFGSADPHNEFDDAARYQLATMAYAIGATHYHRLPALRGPFMTLLRRVIHKMLQPFVWDYWYCTSQASNLFDPDLKELRSPWSDPVVKENIMYSGHLLLMISLYAMLFDDDEFEKPGGITFRFRHWAWGLGPKDFAYDRRSLQDVILKQFEANDWIGCPCEPNAVFVVCNQFPLIATRYNDVRDGTDIISKVLPKYKEALVRKGMMREDMLYCGFFMLKQGKAIPASQGAHTAWANAFMNSWNSERVRASYESQTLGFLTHFNGKTRLQATMVALAFRKLVLEEYGEADDIHTLKKARETHRHVAKRPIPFETLNWGCFTMMLSELGKRKELGDLLEYADERLNPQWENGGLYYPRNDQLCDEDWNLTHVEPHSGNSGIAYSRLNVEDGQKKMWEQPWTKKVLAERPYVDGIGFADGVDFLRGVWDAEASAVVFTLKSWRNDPRTARFSVRNLPPGQWAVYMNGNLGRTQELTDRGDMSIEAEVGPDEVDIIVQQMG